MLSMGIAIPALALEPQKYPDTLIDANCADNFNAGGITSVFRFATLQTETTGIANGKCDSDDRILTGAQTADVIKGPFSSLGSRGVVVQADADTVSGGTSSWAVCVSRDLPHEPGTYRTACCTTAVTGATDNHYFLGNLGSVVTAGNTQYTASVSCPIPSTFYLHLDIAGGIGQGDATSWAGSFSWMLSN